MTEPADTRTQILDSAELLFSEHGYEGVSVRNVTDGAGVRLGLLGYYFGTKENLFDAVVGRRIDELNRRRIEALERRLRDPCPTVAGLVEAFIGPYLELATGGGEGWRAYAKLIAQISHVEQHMPLLKRYLDPVGRRYIDALVLCTGCSRLTAVRAFIFMAAAMVGVFAGPSRIESLSDGALSGRDLRGLYPGLVQFTTAGITAICAGAPS